MSKVIISSVKMVNPTKPVVYRLPLLLSDIKKWHSNKIAFYIHLDTHVKVSKLYLEVAKNSSSCMKK